MVEKGYSNPCINGVWRGELGLLCLALSFFVQNCKQGGGLRSKTLKTKGAQERGLLYEFRPETMD